MPKLPRTAKDALALWDAGEPVPVFRVATEISEQEEIFAAAFEAIRAGGLVTVADVAVPGSDVPDTRTTLDTLASMALAETAATHKLTDREVETAASIAIVALRKGWAAMLNQHESEYMPAATLVNPSPKGKADATPSTQKTA